ncbi:MAG: response regulator [Bacteroidota bacterium]
MSSFKNILIVDDDPEIALLLKRLLTTLVPAEINMKYSINDASTHLSQAAPDLAFVDINLGDGIGYSLVPNLLRNEKARVIIMSATGQPDEEQTVKHHGAHYFLKKPFTLNDVKHALSHT